MIIKHLLVTFFFTTLFASTSTSNAQRQRLGLGEEEEEEEEEEEMRSSQPSSLPSQRDDNGGINDTFEYELCQRLVTGAQVITANSKYCEKLLAAEQLCCPNDKVNVNGSGEEEERMSLDYSFLYWYHAKVGKNEAKARKGKRRGKSRGGKKKLVRDV